jgi:hypothetical protein
MFFRNLEQMKSQIDELLQMDRSTIDQKLINGHDWANDHIATSKDDIEEVYNFFNNELTEGKQRGLWDNIHAKRKRGEKPAKPGDEDYPDKKQWDKLTEDDLINEGSSDCERRSLNKPWLTPDGPKKRSVCVKNDKGNVVKVNFGDPNMRIKKSDPERRKSFRARHNCENPGPKWKARFWSCKHW